MCRFITNTQLIRVNSSWNINIYRKKNPAWI